MDNKIIKLYNGVKITFSEDIKKENIVKMVDNCSKGKCECMSDETKSKIKTMEVTGEDGEVELSLEGEVSVEDIKDAISKSKMI